MFTFEPEAPASAASARSKPEPAVPQAVAAPKAHAFLGLQRDAGNRAVQRRVGLDRSARGGGEVAPEEQEAIDSARGAGQALEGGVRAEMESAFGQDFGSVRIHTDARADALRGCEEIPATGSKIPGT